MNPADAREGVSTRTARQSGRSCFIGASLGCPGWGGSFPPCPLQMLLPWIKGSKEKSRPRRIGGPSLNSLIAEGVFAMLRYDFHIEPGMFRRKGRHRRFRSWLRHCRPTFVGLLVVVLLLLLVGGIARLRLEQE